MEAQVCICLCPETVQKLYLKNFEVGKFQFLWKMSLEKFGFTNSKESVPPEKKAKLTKRQEKKIMMMKKEPELFLSSGQGKSILSH